MATRSPTTTHPFWGVFASTADLPNVAGSPTQKNTLEVGDQAYVNGSGLYVCTDATLGAAIWTAVGGGGGSVVPMHGARGFSALNYYQTAPNACPGVGIPGFEATAVVIAENLREVITRYVLSAHQQFIGPGYAIGFSGTRAIEEITDGGGNLQGIFFGRRWIDDNQSYVLLVLSGGYDGADRFLKLNGKEIFRAAMVGYTPAPALPLRMGAEANSATSPATDAIVVAAAYKGNGVLTDAETREVMRHVLVNGDLPDSQYTSRWSFAGLTGAAPASLPDQIGANDMTLVGALDVVEVRQIGRPTSGAEQTVCTTSEAGFMAPEDKLRDVPLNGLVTGTSPEVIGAVWLNAGTTIQASSRALLGTSGGGTATLRVRRQSTGVLVAGFEWSVAGAIADDQLAANVAIAASDWYTFELLGDAGPTVAITYGVQLFY